MKAVTRSLQMADGDVHYLGRSIRNVGAWDLVAQGLVMVPEGRGVFARMTITENLLMGAYTRNDKAGIDADIERWYTVFPRLKERATQLAGTLSGGEQQMLAIGRGLMAKPKLLIIDEASLGLAPVIVKEVFKIVSRVNADGVTVILVEANISALEIADVGIVFQKGVITNELRGKQLKDVGAVRSLVLG